MNKFARTLIAASALATLAGASFAASVQVYGRVDNGLYYVHKKAGKTTTNEFTMESGMGGASRWGIKADSDEIAPGWKVSVKLEGKICTDTGELGTDNTIFDRESSIIVSSPYGNLQFGRIGYLHGGVTGGLIAGQTNPFGVIYKQCGAQNVFMNAASRTPNTIRYETPSFAGLTFATQWCNSVKDTEEANALPNRQRYFGIGANYKNGPFRIAAVYGTMYYKNSVESGKSQSADGDEHSYSLAANYDFGVAKVFAGYQYGENLANGTSIMGSKFLGAKTHNVIAGVSVPVGNGTIMASAGMTRTKDGKVGGKDQDEKYVKQDGYQCALGYKYSFSKKASFYSALSYRHQKGTRMDDVKVTTKTFTVMAGLGGAF